MNPSLWTAAAKRVGCFALLGCFTVLSRAQNTFIVERGPHHSVVQNTRLETNQLGEVKECVSQHTVLANGLNYWDAAAGEWVGSHERFEVYPQGLVATRGQYHVVIAPDVSSAGSVDLLTPDSLRLRGNCLGVAWYDAANGTTVWLATVRNTVAELLPPNFNQVVFRDSFEGAIKADIIYSYRKGSFEQDVVVREISAGPPSAYGLADETSRLIVVTEWLQAPAPQITQHIWKSESDPVRRAQMVEPDLADETLSFGADMQMILGKAFPLGDPSTTGMSTTTGIPVFKSWRHLEALDRDILVEAVEYSAIKPHLENLPKPVLGQAKALAQGKLEEVLPPARIEQIATEPPRLGSLPYAEKGVVIDFVIVVSQATFTFASGVTYLIQGSVTNSQSSTFQSASYVKFDPNAWLTLQGSINTPASGVAPSFLTHRNDDWVGEAMLPLGTLNSYNARPAISLYYANNGTVLNNLEIRYAQKAIDDYSPYVTHTVQNSRFVNCSQGIGAYYTTVNVNNNIKCDVPTFTYNYGSATFNESGTLTACGEVNATKASSNQVELEIVINPANPNNIVMFSKMERTNAFWKAYSTDGGVNWNSSAFERGSDDVPPTSDPSLAFDRFGNLYLLYLVHDVHKLHLEVSSDGGSTFQTRADFTFDWPTTDIDFPKVRTGPSSAAGVDSVWIAYSAYGWINARGATVTGLGISQISAFGPELAASALYRNFCDMAIGPNGEVIVACQSDLDPGTGFVTIYTRLHTGPPSATFQPYDIPVTTTNKVGFSYNIPAQPNRTIDAAIGLAWDRSGGPYNNRLYLVYTDVTGANSQNTDTFLRYTSNPTTFPPTWSAPDRVNDDPDNSTRSQFWPRVAVDQTTGKIAVSWYDCRKDTANNKKTQFFATISRDGGASFLPNIRVSGAEQSDATLVVWPNVPPLIAFDYGDYTGLAFHGGIFYPAWADNSNSTGDNPDPNNTKLDVYIKKVSAP